MTLWLLGKFASACCSTTTLNARESGELAPVWRATFLCFARQGKTGSKKNRGRDTERDKQDYTGGVQKLREWDFAWCKSLGLKHCARPAKQLFGMHYVTPVLYRSWHPGQRNYDERWLYHDCNCKCKSCSAATLFLCITMSCPNKIYIPLHIVPRLHYFDKQ